MTPGAPDRARRCVLLFVSIHDVLRAEAAVQAGGLWCDLVPVPRALSAECGMALEVAAGDLTAVRAALAAAGAEPTAAWRRGAPDGWEPA
jgi:hypothetical protein